MNAYWLFPLLILGTLFWVSWPLFWPRSDRPLPAGLEGDDTHRWTGERDQLLRQIKELQYEQAAGTLAEQDAHRAQTQLEDELALVFKRLETTQHNRVASVATTREQRPPPSLVHRGAGFLVLILLMLMGTGIYLWRGTPQPIPTDEVQARPNAAELSVMVENYAKKMAQEPEDIEGWLRLARSFTALDRIEDAIHAYAHVRERRPHDLEVLGDLARMRIQSRHPETIQQGKQDFITLLDQDPDRLEAHWYLGVLAYQEQDKESARHHWHILKQRLPENNPMRSLVDQALAELPAPP
jgi:cytochrome c-type biogenesis protein CcmH